MDTKTPQDPQTIVYQGHAGFLSINNRIGAGKEHGHYCLGLMVSELRGRENGKYLLGFKGPPSVVSGLGPRVYGG